MRSAAEIRIECRARFISPLGRFFRQSRSRIICYHDCVMNIPCDKYRDADRRLTMFSIVVFPVMGAFGVAVTLTVGLPIGHAVRDLIGGDLGKLAGIALVFPFGLVLTLLLPLGIMILIDRRIGIRCPNCNVSLTSKCWSEKVLITRKCCHCNSVVLSRENHGPSRSKENLWRVVPLSIIFVGCIAALIVQEVKSGKSTLSQQDWIDFAFWIVAALVIGRIGSIQRRRWKQEASADDPGNEAEE